MNRRPSTEIRVLLANNLKRLRSERGFTQEDLGVMSGLHENYISSVEQGTVNITLANLETLAAGLSCSVASLLEPPLAAKKGVTT